MKTLVASVRSRKCLACDITPSLDAENFRRANSRSGRVFAEVYIRGRSWIAIDIDEGLQHHAYAWARAWRHQHAVGSGILAAERGALHVEVGRLKDARQTPGGRRQSAWEDAGR